MDPKTTPETPAVQTPPAATAASAGDVTKISTNTSGFWVKVNKDFGQHKAGDIYACNSAETRKFLIDNGMASETAGPPASFDFTKGVEEAFQKVVAKTVEVVDQRLAQFAKSATNGAGNFQLPMGGGDMVPAEPREPTAKGAINVARFAIATLVAKQHSVPAAQLAAKNYGENHPVTKALAAGVFTGGGALVPETFSSDFIELLLPNTVIGKMGPDRQPLVNGSLTIPRMRTGASASYLGENVNISTTEPTFGQVVLKSRTLAAIIPVSNDLLRFSAQAERVVLNNLIKSAAVTMDAAMIRNQGIGNAPKGIRYQLAAANAIASNATINLANVTNDLGKLELALLNNNHGMMPERTFWLMAPRARTYLHDLRDGNGNLAFPEVRDGKLRSMPLLMTTSIPINLGGGTDESEVYLVHADDAIVGEDQNLEISSSNEAAYHDGSAVVSAWSLNQTSFRLVMRHDFALRYETAAAVLTGNKWGA